MTQKTHCRHLGGVHYLGDPGGIEFSNRAVKNFVPLPFEASGILYPSQLTCREFCTPPETRKKTSCNKKDFVNYYYKERMERWAIKDTLKNVEKFLWTDVSGILYPSRQRCQEFCTPPVGSVRNSIPLPKNSIPPGSPKQWTRPKIGPFISLTQMFDLSKTMV